MVLSMTGFGRGKAAAESREVSVELKTLNHRYLDISLRLQKSLSFLEEEVRKHLQQHIVRGRVEAYISLKNQGGNPVEITLNEGVLEAYRQSFEVLAKRFSIENRPDLATLAGIPDLFTVTEREEDENLLRRLVFEALNSGLDTLTDMRRQEGQHLLADVQMRTEAIEGMAAFIEERAPTVVEDYRRKLQMRLKELLKSTDLDEARFNTEVAYFADRSNITEELIRLKSHIAQLRQALQAGGAVGRKLDFLAQEMNREANTIGSKSSDMAIGGCVVDMKSEIEKIREQIQNFE